MSYNKIKEFFTIDEGRNYKEIVREYILNEKIQSKMQFTILLKDTMKPIGRQGGKSLNKSETAIFIFGK